MAEVQEQRERVERARTAEAVLRRQASLWLWLANVLVGTAIGFAYLGHLQPAADLRLWLFRHLGLLSTIGTLSLAPGLALLLAARSRRTTRLVAALHAAVWMLFHLGLVIDTRIFRLFGYHFNGSAVNLLFSRGSEDVFRLDWRILGPALLICSSLALGELLAWRWISGRVLRSADPSGRRRMLRPAAACCALLAAAVCVEKAIYAQAELTADRSVTAVSQVFPMYPRLTVKPLLPEGVRAWLDEEQVVPVSFPGAELEYPRERPAVDPRGPRPNILVLVVDSWRADMLDAEVTPGLARIASESRRFEDHLSTGNGTRFGIFGLIYGLHGTYWWPMLEARRPPVLLETLVELGYDARIFSSASMDFPELRSTAWASLPDRVHDDFADPRPSRRDALAADACRGWWNERRARGERAPFFTFVLLDAAHQPYDFPEDAAAFAPYAAELDYLELAGSRDPQLVQRVRNRYRNALRHVDAVAAGLVDDLRAAGELEDTLLVVTGDHGEEFAEHGYWGHTGNFTREQVAVPFLLRGPGVAPGAETRPTSHIDLPRTLLGLLGADPASAAGWCLGRDLLQPAERRTRVVAGWEDLGLVTDREILRLPREPRRAFFTSALTFGWELAPDQREPFERERGTLERVSRECARFFRDPQRLLALGRAGG